MTKTLIILLASVFIFIVFSPVSAADGIVLEELIKPDAILARDGKLYVLERTSIYIYSLKTQQLLKKFGREGEGPQEFWAQPFGPPMTISFYRDQLVVNSANKLSFFNLDGEYISERKAPPNAVFFRVEEGYLGIGMALGEDNNQYICYRLFDDNFQNPKMVYQSEIMLGRISRISMPMNALNYYPITKDRIFIVNGKLGFVIEGYNHAGDKLFTVSKEDVKTRKVADSYRIETLKWFKNHPFFRNQYEQLKEAIKFKDHYPAIKSMAIDGQTLYVITNLRKNSSYEYIAMDLSGKELGRGWVPLQESEPFTYYPLLLAVDDGAYYALIEGDDEESWLLHTRKLK